MPAEAVFAKERSKLAEEGLKPLEQLTLEPYERDHCVVTGVVRLRSCADGLVWAGAHPR